MNHNQLLSIDQLLNIQNEIFNKIKSAEQELLTIQNSSGHLVEKWQQLLQVILPIQLEAIKPYNLDDSQSGLSQFNEEYVRGSVESPLLLALNKQKWLFIFEKTFGLTEVKEISLQKAQRLIADIVNEMTSEDFLSQVDHVIKSTNGSSLIERRQALLTILFPLHMSVMAKHGFEGTDGYIQAQKAVMDHYYDPLIVQTTAYAQSVVFKRARLI